MLLVTLLLQTVHLQKVLHLLWSPEIGLPLRVLTVMIILNQNCFQYYQELTEPGRDGSHLWFQLGFCMEKEDQCMRCKEINSICNKNIRKWPGAADRMNYLGWTIENCHLVGEILAIHQNRLLLVLSGFGMSKTGIFWNSQKLFLGDL